MKKCKHCNREEPGYGEDMTCAKGGYCEWVYEAIIPDFTDASNHPTSPTDVPWLEGNGVQGKRMSWTFPYTAIIQSFEIEPLKPSIYGADYNGFITALRIGMVEYLHISPYPISMWSPGMPAVQLWLPSVPNGYHLTIETQGFHGKIRPRGLVLNP